MKRLDWTVKRRISILVMAAAASGAALWAQAPQDKKPDTIIATDYPDLNAAVDAARRLRVGRVYMPAGTYLIKKSLNLTEWSTPENIKPLNLLLEGTGQSTVLIGDTGGDPVIDMSGSAKMILRNFIIQSPEKDGKWLPGGSVGILMARKAVSTGSPSSVGHCSFENVQVNGNYSVACVMSYCAEENIYYNCKFHNEGGDGFIYTGENKEGVTSPHMKLQASSNVVATFYFPWFWTGKKDSVGMRISSGGEVYLYSAFFATYGETFAALYLDDCSKIRLSSVRQEGVSGHSIYAAGAVSDVIIDGCTFMSWDAENIHFQEKVPNMEGAHKNVPKPDFFGKASNWTITGSSFYHWFHADPQFTYDARQPLPEGFTSLRFESLQNSRMENNVFNVTRQYPGTGESAIETDLPLVVVENYSRRNTFELPSREALDLRGDAKSNTVVGQADDLDEKVPSLWRTQASQSTPSNLKLYDGARRTYLDPDSSGSLMNLGRVDVFKIKKPRAGDVAIHDGTGFDDRKPRLAMFDGSEWVFFAREESPKPR